jgi:hypothetical protein
VSRTFIKPFIAYAASGRWTYCQPLGGKNQKRTVAEAIVESPWKSLSKL